MIRKGKGHSVQHYIKDYTVINLETTSSYTSSTHIIEIGALKVRNGIITKEYSTLVNPNCYVPSHATALNHITDDMVKNAPALDEVLDDFISFIGPDIVLGYNCENFDINIIYDRLKAMRGQLFRNNYIDLLHAAQRMLTETSNHRTITVFRHFGLNTDHMNRALKDCHLIKDCYEKFYEEFGDKAFKRQSSENTPRKIHTKYQLNALNELSNILETILADGIISKIDFLFLSKWVTDHRDLGGYEPFNTIISAIDSMLVDREISVRELDALQEFLSQIKDASHIEPA